MLHYVSVEGDTLSTTKIDPVGLVVEIFAMLCIWFLGRKNSDLLTVVSFFLSSTYRIFLLLLISHYTPLIKVLSDCKCCAYQ